MSIKLIQRKYLLKIEVKIIELVKFNVNVDKMEPKLSQLNNN